MKFGVGANVVARVQNHLQRKKAVRELKNEGRKTRLILFSSRYCSDAY